MNKTLLLILTAILIVLFTGCINPNQQDTQVEELIRSNNQIVKLNGQLQNEIIDMSNRLVVLESKDTQIVNPVQQYPEANGLESRITRLENLTTQYGLVTSKNSLIPEHLPFKITLTGAKDQGSWTYLFKENGFFDFQGIGYSDTDAATYKLYQENNTIIINSDKYDYYGLRLIDGYGYTISKTGLPQYSYVSTITHPRYNPESQRYELE